MKIFLFISAVLIGMPAFAAPEISLRPQMRDAGNDLVRTQTGLSPTGVALSARQSGGLLARSLRPQDRPKALVHRVMGQRERRTGGGPGLCGDPAIQGEVVGRVPGRIPGCGVEDAVRVQSVSGIALSQGAVVDCPTARAFKTWIEQGVRPALRSRGEVTRIRIAAHYVCRTRNHQPGARISEHGKGKAIDVSAFHMQSGEVITLSDGWRARGTSQALRQMHRAACGPFGTVLGPEADRFHQDHFHFDTARHRGGPYCR